MDERTMMEIRSRFDRLSLKTQFWVRLLDAERGNGVARLHAQLCHANGSTCLDGCEAPALDDEEKASESAATFIAFRDHPEDYGFHGAEVAT